MQATSIVNIKKELKHKSPEELTELCLRLSKFKKENKELITYLLFESDNEGEYIESIKTHIDTQFDAINTKSFFFIRKSVRKILSQTKKYIRYSQKKETEVELLLYFLKTLKHFKPSYKNSGQLQNLYNRQLELVKKTVSGLHEDLQYDYNLLIENL
ncbi:hypothetical protein [Aestuariibaculum sediminum]|uniref:Uncharacterized protein n=1 Tax=Aestuariibaculum sediminum TaxID=2770637 RepID=A0A8J6Q8J3_9FLAO|nr:hypothetical protein [Aestuariibaculum sediminum]MBD0832790.1 hypothetical protein [Aestuariibaculum sediminum]